MAALFLMSLIIALALFPSVYMELTDLTLWIFTILFLYIFSRIDVNLKALKNSLYFISTVQLFSGTLDLILKFSLYKRLLDFLPSYESFKNTGIPSVEFFSILFYRVQGILPEPSYFGIISVFLFISFRMVNSKDRFFSILLIISVFLSYSILAITLLILYYIFTFTSYSLMSKTKLILILLILIPIVNLDGSLINQFIIKLSGEHVSGLGRYTKFITAINLIVERPFLGYQPGYFVSILGTQPGNVYVTLVLENGLVGLLFFSIFIWLTYRSAFKISNLNILVPQFSAFFFIGAFSNPIFFLPLIYCFHKERLKLEFNLNSQ